MKAPLGARLEVPGRAPVDVSEILTDFTYRLGVPGGFLGGDGKLWASIEDYDIRANTRLTITDGRTAETLWQGYLDSPGDSFDETGEAFDLNAQGAMVLVGDQAEQLLYLDSSYENWRADDRNDTNLAPSGEGSASAWPDTEQDALLLQLASGTPIGKGDEARMIHDLADTCPMGVGGYSFKTKSGINSNGYALRVTLGGVLIEQINMQTSTHFMAGVLGVNITDPFDVLKIRLRRMSGATNVGTDKIWAGFADPYVVGDRLDRFGDSQLSSGSLPNLTYVRASEVVEDLVARLMPMVDPHKVFIHQTDYHIDQLTYADAMRASGVLEDLELFEPNWLWRVTAAGTDQKYGFEYVKWPTTPRYEISLADGYSAPGGESTQANRVAVTWTDRKGRERTEIVTRYVPELGGTPANPLAGARIVDAEKVTLDETVSSLANAQRIGEQYLRLVNNPPKAATASIVRPIRDLQRGGMVAPWEIEPGKVARLRETGENLRITEVAVNTETCTAELTLGQPRPTLERLIARLRKPKRRKS